MNRNEPLCAPSKPTKARLCVHILVDRPLDTFGDNPSDDLRVVLVSPGRAPSDVLTMEGVARPYAGIPSVNPYLFYGEVVELYAGVPAPEVSITVSQCGGAWGLDSWAKHQAKRIVV